MAQKKSYSAILKRIVAALSSLAKEKTLALKSKTNALKTRIIIFSLLNNKKFVMNSISHKFQALLSHHHHHHVHQEPKLKPDEDVVMSTEQSNNSIKALEVLNINAVMENKTLPDHDQYQNYVIQESEKELKENVNVNGNCGCEKCSELQTQYSLLLETEMEDVKMEEEEDKGASSVIEMVKNSKKEKGEEFRLEDEIDHVADLFIKRFHRHIMFQKQHSFKSFNSDQMLQSCTA